MPEINIFAMPDPRIPDLHGEGLDSARQAMYDHSQQLGYQFIPTISSIDDLISSVRVVVRTWHGCLRVLELHAHGNPQLCDGLDQANARHLGHALHTITLCDVVDIYLAGCNTGVQDHGSESVAQVLSRYTPTQAHDNVRVIVHGSVGYMSGNHAQGNESCTESCETGKGSGKIHWDPYPAHGGQPGSQAATGKACWRGFVEGQQI